MLIKPDLVLNFELNRYLIHIIVLHVARLYEPNIDLSSLEK